MKTQEVLIQIHKTKIRIKTNYPAYYDYLRFHFNKIILRDEKDNCQIDVNATWKVDFWGNHPPYIEKKEGMRAIGANTLIGSGCISTIRKVGKKTKLWLNYLLDKNKLILDASLHKKTIKDKMRYGILGQPPASYFFELTYPLVYYPLFWHLEYFKDTHMLHASAVKIKDKCVVICGLDGIGKTTLSLSLSKEPSTRLFSDNLILYDKDSIFACYEPIRISKSDDKSIWEGKFNRINAFRTLKDFYEPVSFDLELKARPDIAIIPSFANSFSVRRITGEEFVHKALNINQLTAELGNYNEYSALLNLLVSRSDIAQAKVKALSALLNLTQCYEISMRKEDGVEKNLDKLKESLLA
jgi:hypothetical protein